MQAFKTILLKLNRELLYLRRDVWYRLGGYDKYYKSARGSRILIYHGICLTDNTRFNPIFLTLKTFNAHLKFYKKYFNVISLNDYYQQKFSRERFNVCLTFDDGFANNHKYVLPLLEQYNMPATFFITAIRAKGYDILWNDFLGIISKYGPKKLNYKNEFYLKNQHEKYINIKTGISINEELRNCGFKEKAEAIDKLYSLAPFKLNRKHEDYWLQMTNEQIKEISRSPFASIGAHGYYHNDLARIDLADANEELVLTKNFLEQLSGKPVNSIAFPYGSYNGGIVSLAKNAGYNQLLAVDFLSRYDYTDSTMRERFTVNPFISTPNQMHATINRRYEKH